MKRLFHFRSSLDIVFSPCVLDGLILGFVYSGGTYFYETFSGYKYYILA